MEPFNSMREDSELAEGCKIGNPKVTVLYSGPQRTYTFEKRLQ